jgi:hypothetical protein
VKAIRLAEGPQFRNFTLKTVCYTRRPACSSVTTRWTSSLAISERRILISFIRLMARPRFCTIRDAGVGLGAKRRSAGVHRCGFHHRRTARSRLFMSTSTRRPHNVRNGKGPTRRTGTRLGALASSLHPAAHVSRNLHRSASDQTATRRGRQVMTRSGHWLKQHIRKMPWTESCHAAIAGL